MLITPGLATQPPSGPSSYFSLPCSPSTRKQRALRAKGMGRHLNLREWMALSPHLMFSSLLPSEHSFIPPGWGHRQERSFPNASFLRYLTAASWGKRQEAMAIPFPHKSWGLGSLGLEDLTVLWRSSGGQGHKLPSLAVCDPLCRCLSISRCPPGMTVLGLFSPQVSVAAFRTQLHSPSLLESTELGCGRSSCGTQKARQELGIGCSWDRSRAIVSSCKSWDPSGSV